MCFDNTNIILYDNHLLDLIKFISNFLGFILRDAIKTSHLKRKKKNISNIKIIPSKTVVELLFKKVVIQNVIDCEDIMILKFKDFRFVVFKKIIIFS